MAASEFSGRAHGLSLRAPNVVSAPSRVHEGLDSLINRAWSMRIEARRSAAAATVPMESMSILFFGDLAAYRASPMKIVTVGLNPSLREFPKDAPWSRFPEGQMLYAADTLDADQRNTYLNGLCSYFDLDREPYRWFGCFEPLLHGADASYYPGKQSRALHTDLMSPVPTDPTWSGLTPQQRLVHADGPRLWRDLIQFLAPDVIIVSVAERHLAAMADTTIEWNQVPLDGVPPGLVRECTLGWGDHMAHVVFGRAARVPLGRLSNGNRREIGKRIRMRFDPSS